MRNKKGKESKTDINDSLYKTIIVLGNSSVGKTSILSQLTKNQFNSNHTSTIGLDYYHKIVEIPNTPHAVNLSLWDTNGEEKELSLLPAKQYIKSNAFLIVCSYDNLESYEKLIEWITFIRTQREKSNNIFVNRTLNTTIVIINKSDIKNKQFTKQDVYSLVHSCFPTVFISEMNANNTKKVKVLFDKLIILLLKENREFIKSLKLERKGMTVNSLKLFEECNNDENINLCNKSIMIDNNVNNKCKSCC